MRSAAERALSQTAAALPPAIPAIVPDVPQSPHAGVCVRLGRSPIHGLGVFATERIPAGTNVFANDRREITWVPRSIMDDPALSDFQRKFYEDFAIRCGKQLGCPANFNLLTVGWYVNEPKNGPFSPVLRHSSRHHCCKISYCISSLGSPMEHVSRLRSNHEA